MRSVKRKHVLALGIAVAVLLVAGPAFTDGLERLEERLLGGAGDPGAAARPRVVDGDTFALAGAGVTVRVALVDAGESSASRYGRPTCGGAEAKRFAEAWADRHGSVRVRAVRGLPREDRYDRRLGRVVGATGSDYGLAVVGRGWARVTVYEPPRGSGAVYLARLRAAEAGARAGDRGGWGRCRWE